MLARKYELLSDTMNAAHLIFEDQIDETPVEARIAKLESDVGYVKDVLDDIKLNVKAANDSIAALQVDVGGIKATLPHLATKADLKETEGSLNARINSVEGSLSAKLNAMETKILRWIIGTVIGMSTLAFSVAKFLS